jgi:multicomponent Na+:H+ antiporter subunit G
MGDASLLTGARDIVAGILLILGLLLTLTGALGVIKLPDFYTRLHAAGVTDTGGALLILFGLAVLSGWSFASLKLLLIALFLMLTAPVISHLLAQSAHVGGREPLLGNSARAKAPAPKAKKSKGESA